MACRQNTLRQWGSKEQLPYQLSGSVLRKSSSPPPEPAEEPCRATTCPTMRKHGTKPTRSREAAGLSRPIPCMTENQPLQHLAVSSQKPKPSLPSAGRHAAFRRFLTLRVGSACWTLACRHLVGYKAVVRLGSPKERAEGLSTKRPWTQICSTYSPFRLPAKTISMDGRHCKCKE